MGSAVGKYFRALFYLFTFRVNKATEVLQTNPGVISASYDQIVNDKRQRLNQYKDAVASMITQEEKKKHRLKALAEEVAQLEKLRTGAAAKARKLVETHGGDAEAVKRDPEYLKCQAAYKDFSSTLVEKQKRAEELEADLQELVNSIGGDKSQLQSLMRSLEKLREEKHDAVADVLSAQEERQVADLMTGISEDRTSEELRELRDTRQKLRANARMSRELAGLDTKRAEQEFLEYATASETNDEFDALIGLSKKEAETPKHDSPAKIPEQ